MCVQIIYAERTSNDNNTLSEKCRNNCSSESIVRRLKKLHELTVNDAYSRSSFNIISYYMYPRFFLTGPPFLALSPVVRHTISTVSRSLESEMPKWKGMCSSSSICMCCYLTTCCAGYNYEPKGSRYIVYTSRLLNLSAGILCR